MHIEPNAVPEEHVFWPKTSIGHRTFPVRCHIYVGPVTLGD